MTTQYSWYVSGDTITFITQTGEVKHLSRTNKYADTILRLLVNSAHEAEILMMLDRAAAMRRTVDNISTKVGGHELKIVIKDGVPTVTYDGEVLGGVVVEKIVQFMDEGLPVGSLAKFLMRLMTNTSFNSRKQLYSFLQVLQAPITCEGTFLAYKGVRADYKDCHTGTIDNSPGAVPPRMERKNVDDNPENHCSNGYHVAAWQFASTFGARTVLVEVDPADVVSVPSDHGAMKCRVCGYKVLSDVTQPLTGPLKDINPDAGHDDADEEEDTEPVCPECGGPAEFSDDGSVLCSECDTSFCKLLYTCNECGFTLKTTDDPVEYKPNFCPECKVPLNYDRT